MPLVACVDDSPQIHQQMQHTLEENLCRCLSIRDALRALPLLLEAKPDIIFLDVVMPVVNGYELCAQIRRSSALQDVPVVFLTSQDGIVDRLRAKLVGASGFLAKPVRGDRVSEVLVQHLCVPRSLPSN
ncbi:MAG: response regulator [Coleofasciculaceae cyanobacterium SM2_3_26]|nr:response regulator [Coleofasciculaceae cyanobacterium SM2_3_26]